MKIIKAIKDATTFLELHTNQSSQQCKIEAEEIFMFVFGVTNLECILVIHFYE